MSADREAAPASDLGERTGYRFRDAALERAVFTHRSYRHENPEEDHHDNERLEFLGDSVLGFLISRTLFHRFTDRSEGELSRLRASLVSAPILARKARQLDLGRELRLGRGEERSGGREKDSILSDAYESLVAGIFLDGGLEAAEAFVEGEFREDIARLELGARRRDHKSHLQEALHAAGRPAPDYQVVVESGPDHHKLFEVAVLVDDREVARGQGRSKKLAQQDAARAAIEVLGLDGEP